MNEEKLFRYFSGQTSKKENEEIVLWVEASEENRNEFRKMHLIFAGMALYAPKKASRWAPLKLIWNNKRVQRIMQVAAVIAMMLGSYYIGGVLNHESLSEQTMKIMVAKGQRVEVVLSDSTHVQLNSGSTLEYPSVFSRDMRQVKLTGEALFDVKHSEEHPFVVETYACDVKVLGTKFNVLADKSHELFSTALLRGKISVKNRESGQEVIATPNTKIDLKNGNLELSQITDQDNYLWPDGIISLGGLSFEQLIYKLENSFNVEFVLARETVPVINYSSLKIRVSDGIEHAMQVLQYASDFEHEYDRDNKRIIIK